MDKYGKWMHASLYWAKIIREEKLPPQKMGQCRQINRTDRQNRKGENSLNMDHYHTLYLVGILTFLCKRKEEIGSVRVKGDNHFLSQSIENSIIYFLRAKSSLKYVTFLFLSYLLSNRQLTWRGTLFNLRWWIMNLLIRIDTLF